MTDKRLSTDKPAKSKEEKLDRALEDSFPTSDPPSFNPGAVGEPKRKEDSRGETK